MPSPARSRLDTIEVFQLNATDTQGRDPAAASAHTHEDAHEEPRHNTPCL